MAILMVLVIYVLFFLVIYFIKVLFSLLKKKVVRIIPSYVIFSFLFWIVGEIYLSWMMPMFGGDTLEVIPSLIVIFNLLSLYALFCLFEMAGKYVSVQNNVNIFVFSILSVVFSVQFNFACQYDLIFAVNGDAFAGLSTGNRWEIFLEFLLYSFGLLMGNQISSIEPNTLQTRFLCYIEVFFSFLLLVLFISLYREIGMVFTRSFKTDNKPQRSVGTGLVDL